MIEIIPYIILVMTFWDFSIHVIDKHDRKYRLTNQNDKTWFLKMKKSKSLLSHYYPFFWGKKIILSEEKGWKRYDTFWLSYWGTAFILAIIYIIFS